MDWWNDAVGYEIYIRSFADSDGNGIGDLKGISERLDHLAWLGVDVVWITPFYPSPQADFGYDVADYTGVDPQFGDLAAFDLVVERARQLGLRVMVDLVPNHSSAAHPWFRQAISDPDGPYRNYYLFRPPGPDGGPPNNWLSNFGGPAWTLEPSGKEYFCHLFLPEQPDLNWSNEAVRQEFDAVISFWMERGVDGFRIDVAHALMKHPSFADNPQIRPLGEHPTPHEAFAAYEHIYDQNQASSRDIYRRWKTLAGEDTFFLGEVYVTEPAQGASYMNDGGIDLSLFFALNRRPWDPIAFASDIRAWAEQSPAGFAWTIASHDENRPVTRFGGGDTGRARAISLWTALAMLPGMPFLYQGEELGLEDGIVAPEDVQDPVGLEALAEGRDPCRTPMPWEPGPHGGFTTASEAWLRSAPRGPEETVALQREDPASPLHTYRRFLAVRKRISEFRQGPLRWLDADPGVVAFSYRGLAVIANLVDHATEVSVASDWETVFDSTGTEMQNGTGTVKVPPRSTWVLILRS